VPGDEIMGFVTRGQGVSVHRTDCPNAKALMNEPERLIDVSWRPGKSTSFVVSVQVEALDRTRLLSDVGGEVLVVPQFTLYGSVRKGRRPSWDGAAPPELAADRVEAFARALEARGATVRRGAFREHMEVELVNDGPVTIWIDAAEL
jgi:hypothetical protein